MSMHKDFPQWYQAALVEPDEAQIKEGRAALGCLIKAWKETPNITVALDLVRLAVGCQPRDWAQVEALLAAMNLGEPRSILKQRGFALQILVGAAVLFEKPGGQEADVFALATTCASFRHRSGPVPIERAARTYLCKRSVEVRQAAMIESVPDALAIAREEPQARRLNVLQEQMNALREQAKKQVKVLQEERDMLWWLLKGYNETFSQDHTQMAQNGTPLIAARELAGLTRLIPGPLAAPALLHQILGTPSEVPKLTLMQAVDGTPLCWRQEVADVAASSPALDLCPVHQMLRQSLQTDSGLDWGGEMHSPLKLAVQAYEEALLLQLTKPGQA